MVDDRVRGGRHARRVHDLLRVRLRALEPRRGRARPEARHPGRGARVGEPGHQRRLGAGHDQLDAGRDRRAGERLDVAGADVEHARVAQDAGVARGAEHLGALRGAQQRAHDRVLAPAAADDEDAHYSEAMKSSIGIAVSVS